MKKKLSILAAAAFALSLVGCANTSKARDADEPPLDEATDYGTQARKDRQGAPTVYEGEPSGDSGRHSTVRTPDGKTWDVQEEPGESEPRTPATQEGDEATGGAGDVKEDVEIIDEGPTDAAPQE